MNRNDLAVAQVRRYWPSAEEVAQVEELGRGAPHALGDFLARAVGEVDAWLSQGPMRVGPEPAALVLLRKLAHSSQEGERAHYCCATCGSLDVRSVGWVDLNAWRIAETDASPSEPADYCDCCDALVGLVMYGAPAWREVEALSSAITDCGDGLEARTRCAALLLDSYARLEDVDPDGSSAEAVYLWAKQWKQRGRPSFEFAFSARSWSAVSVAWPRIERVA